MIMRSFSDGPLSRHGRGRRTRSGADGVGKKRRSRKPLPTLFRHSCFSYHQLAREGDLAIYKQRWCGRSDSSIAYEVIRIRRHDGFVIDGRIISPAEVYPTARVCGEDGFTLCGKDAAFAKLKALLAKKNFNNKPAREKLKGTKT
jgi:hypothetical protein